MAGLRNGRKAEGLAIVLVDEALGTRDECVKLRMVCRAVLLQE